MIDIHTHILYHWDREPLTEDILSCRMDALGMEKFVVLPVIGPEVPYYYFGTEDVLEVHGRNPDRVIPFCNIDPRAGKNSPETDFSPLIDRYLAAGCRGLGELTANIYFDDPKCLNLFRQCGEAGLPVLFHLYGGFSGSYGLVDDLKLPRIERALNLCAGTKFIGHAPAFWAEISSCADGGERSAYPKGPVKEPGRLQELFDRYPNLYGDISAGSGYNALTRDKDYGYEFMEKYRARLLFGTDLCHPSQETPIVEYVKEALSGGKISKAAFGMVTRENAIKLLDL